MPEQPEGEGPGTQLVEVAGALVSAAAASLLSLRPELDGRLQGVASSMISSVGYDASTQTMTVLFNSGREYEYPGVPLEVFDALMAAPSKGRFMRSAVIGVYD